MQFKAAAGAAWRARKTFRCLPPSVAREFEAPVPFPDVADPSRPHHGKTLGEGTQGTHQASLGTVPPCGIMPVLRRVTLSALVISLAGNLTWKTKRRWISIAVRIDPIDSRSLHLLSFIVYLSSVSFILFDLPTDRERYLNQF